MLNIVRCLVRPEELQKVIDTLMPITSGMTVWDVRDNNPETNRKATYRGLEYEVELPRVAVEIVVDGSRVDDIVKNVIEAHRIGLIEDGRIFVSPVQESYHVRNGFMDI
jgi:nitrogen regulatory protein PII